MKKDQSNVIDIGKRRLMLYKAILEFPDNQRIRKAFMRTYATEFFQLAMEDGVYISYSRADEIFAIELDTELRQTGVNVWLDEIDVDPSEDWHYAVSTALNRSGVMLFVLSPNSVTDDQLIEDAISFLELGKIVVPILHKPCDDTLLPDFVVPPIDFSEDFDMGLKLLLKQLTGHAQVRA